MGSHQASSIRSVLAPIRMAALSASPVSPGLAIDHLALLGWSPPYSWRISALCAKPPEANTTPWRARIRRGSVAHGADPDHAALLHDQFLHRRIRPDRDPTSERDLQHLSDQGGTVREQLLAAHSGEIGPGHDAGGDVVNAPTLRL